MLLFVLVFRPSGITKLGWKVGEAARCPLLWKRRNRAILTTTMVSAPHAKSARLVISLALFRAERSTWLVAELVSSRAAGVVAPACSCSWPVPLEPWLAAVMVPGACSPAGLDMSGTKVIFPLP